MGGAGGAPRSPLRGARSGGRRSGSRGFLGGVVWLFRSRWVSLGWLSSRRRWLGLRPFGPLRVGRDGGGGGVLRPLRAGIGGGGRVGGPAGGPGRGRVLSGSRSPGSGGLAGRVVGAPGSVRAGRAGLPPVPRGPGGSGPAGRPGHGGGGGVPSVRSPGAVAAASVPRETVEQARFGQFRLTCTG